MVLRQLALTERLIMQTVSDFQLRRWDGYGYLMGTINGKRWRRKFVTDELK
jgi:hypothetical protein